MDSANINSTNLDSLVHDISTPTPIKQVNPKRKKIFVILAIILGVIFLLGLVSAVLGYFAYQKITVVKSKIYALKDAGTEAYGALKAQNLVLADDRFKIVQSRLSDVEAEYQSLSWASGLPYVGPIYKDAGHGLNAGKAGLNAAITLVKAIEPYADVLGFKGQGSFSGGSAEERIVKIIDTLGKVTPSLDSVISDLNIVEAQLSQIDENRYPENFRGFALRSSLKEAKNSTKLGVEIMTKARPIIEVLPDLAGGTSRRKYLVLFQNSGELRPTGGFMTGYAILNVDKGKVEPEGSGDIYELDKNFKNKPPIPSILKKFLTTETRFNLRDMNISPDFKISMDTFYENYRKVPGQPSNLDGIIAVDTHFLSSLVKVLGEIDVPGYGKFSAANDPRCDCPQIIYALSEIVDRPTNYIRENRKGILGPMMKTILTKAYGAPKQIWPELFTTGWQSIESKHVLMYFFTDKFQAAAEGINAAGRVLPAKDGEDYVMLVDTNLAGAKSNFFVENSVAHEIDLPQNGELKHKITVTYKNPFKASNCNLEAGQLCLNGTLNDWVRLYLPKDAKLIEARGLDEGSVLVSQDLGHAVIEGVFKLSPLSQAKIEITYTIPYTATKYNAMIQKQAGTEDIKHTFNVNGLPYDLLLKKDTSVSYSF